MNRWIQKAMKKLEISKGSASNILSMNQRNLWFIYPNNPRRHFPLADDKLKTKTIMEQAGVRVPKTYRTYQHFYQLKKLEHDLSSFNDFVIKPSQGRGGGGILVIAGQKNNQRVGISGEQHSIEEIRKHLADIMFGVYSFDMNDAAMVEERVIQDPNEYQI